MQRALFSRQLLLGSTFRTPARYSARFIQSECRVGCEWQHGIQHGGENWKDRADGHTCLPAQLLRSRKPTFSSTTTLPSSPQLSPTATASSSTGTTTTTLHRATSVLSEETHSDTLEHLHSPWLVKHQTRELLPASRAPSGFPGISC